MGCGRTEIIVEFGLWLSAYEVRFIKSVLDHATAQASPYGADFYVWTQEQAALPAPTLPSECPLSLDDLLAPDFDLSRCAELIAASIGNSGRGGQ